MILPYLIQILLAVVGLAVSLGLIAAVCYVTFALLNEILEEDDNVANK